MIKVLKLINKKQRLYVGISIVFIVVQVWLDLKLPDYMSNITTLVETSGSKMSDILVQGGYMLLCALGSMAAAMVVGYLAAKVAAGLARTLRGQVYNKTMDFSMEEVGRFSTSSLINRTSNDITQIQNLVAMGLLAIIKAPIMMAIVGFEGMPMVSIGMKEVCEPALLADSGPATPSMAPSPKGTSLLANFFSTA